MADVIPISGGPEEAKIRNVIGTVLLPLVTLGIYSLVWYYKINREMADLGRKQGREDLGTSPGKSLLAVTLGVFIIVPPFLSIAGTWQRMKRSQQLVGVPEASQGNAAIFVVLLIFTGPIAYGYLQNELNKVWKAQPAAGTPAAPAASTETPAVAGIPGA